MPSYNRVVLIGNLTKDPQLSYLPTQTAACEFRLAVDERWRDPAGQMRERPMYIDCVAYGRMGELVSQYCAKGKLVLVDGRLQYDQWQTADGQKRSKHKVRAMSVEFLDSPTRPAGQPTQPERPTRLTSDLPAELPF